ncbi:4Fe-4S ferredoxin, iron-sulfur binding domain protein [Thermosinus carboxydivorans Nor1]|uniref:4Fe-4S ferredoxin, iron-sulfur binding domain protein n=1 Tax=Thermosinus carboxydivorans Nor1 TaxID=401526 RepID=A1HQY2_9FIRM|nr:4Fe-4S binding protein [Thermosinus carboxydivorans]EAX47491.1 4Fe-4S ferredoxin, iron-sulfur binding domain protein [Thermosinus carboxydivorans Nor1]
MPNKIQPYLFWILLAFLAIGYFYPAIGVIAIVCMLAPVLLAPFKGRYWCGNFCPRGSFYDTVLAKFSPKKPIPAFFRSKGFRLFMIFFIMTVFTVQMYYAWGDWPAMGMVFLRLIFITTLVGIILGFLFHHRTWCSFCPMGTMASWFSAKAKPLQVDATCVNCKLCSRVCPFGLTPYEAKSTDSGYLHPDCLKCSRCVVACPKKALHF